MATSRSVRIYEVITIMKRMCLVLILSSITALIGCVAPGAPLIRTSQHDGEGQMITGCKNVSSKSRVDIFIKNSYLTTWGSALKEGAIEGVEEGVDQAGVSKGASLVRSLLDTSLKREEIRARLQSSPESSWNEKINKYSSKTIPFCRKYSANSAAVFLSAVDALGTLDYPITIVDKKLGIIETGFVERRHSGARWRDRYVIYIDPENDEPDHSITHLKIFRTVYIDRSGNTFNEADSVGYNETWIMTRVADVLEEKNRLMPISITR